ncbi:MAG: DUF1549 and DUF1553 domain-containing protein, partial [Planctomycetota bacterium]
SRWGNGPIDQFVFAQMRRQGFRPSPQADRATLVRRLYLDLIGVLPTLQQADAFVNDARPDAYARLVDELLASPRYGERWARPWLDLARYSDTNGYEKDRPRTMWPYRDWVVRALNDDMPYDQFSIEQIAGDMLPGATVTQRIATGFHRNTMLNEEGGIDPLEYRYYAMVDRVATTGTVWMGLTTGCAQCHTHKYDPITHTDYFRMMAILNNADEPDLMVPDDPIRQQRESIQSKIRQMQSDLVKQFPNLTSGTADTETPDVLGSAFESWIERVTSNTTDWKTIQPIAMQTNLPILQVMNDGSIFASGDITKRDVFTLSFDLADLLRANPSSQDSSSVSGAGPVRSIRLEVLPDARLPAGGPGRCYYEGRKGDFFLSEFSAEVDGQPFPFSDGSHSYGKISVGSGTADAKNVFDGEGSTGWSTSDRMGQASELVLNFADPLPGSGTLKITLLFERHFAASLGHFRLSVSENANAIASGLPRDLQLQCREDPATWPTEQRQIALQHFLMVSPKLADARKPIEALRSKMPKQAQAMVMQERPSGQTRPTHRHHRGEYLSPSEAVSPGIPAFLKRKDTAGAGAINRLEFARWLVGPDNPLAARVAVNRAWRSFFGAGLIRSGGDFGTQSPPPTHPELLDWLAVEFVRRGWSMKQIHRMIVHSATYRQSSHLPEDAASSDPENRWLSRGPRHRLEAEMIRDSVLSASGILSHKMFGPGVYPPQPASVTSLAYGSFRWKASVGEDRFRRSIYTFAKRTAPFAAFTNFDGPTGETCVARRDRSNTPLQALTLLNDAMYVEIACEITRSVLSDVDQSADESDIATGIFRRLLTRRPDGGELNTLLSFYRRQHDRLKTNQLDPNAFLRSAAKQQPPNVDLATYAAWSMTTRAIMNLDEMVTKQ